MLLQRESRLCLTLAVHDVFEPSLTPESACLKIQMRTYHEDRHGRSFSLCTMQSCRFDAATFCNALLMLCVCLTSIQGTLLNAQTFCTGLKSHRPTPRRQQTSSSLAGNGRKDRLKQLYADLKALDEESLAGLPVQ